MQTFIFCISFHNLEVLKHKASVENTSIKGYHVLMHLNNNNEIASFNMGTGLHLLFI